MLCLGICENNSLVLYNTPNSVYNNSTRNKCNPLNLALDMCITSSLHFSVVSYKTCHVLSSGEPEWPHSPVWRTPLIERWSSGDGRPSFWPGGWYQPCVAARTELWACRCWKIICTESWNWFFKWFVLLLVCAIFWSCRLHWHESDQKIKVLNTSNPSL